MKYLLRAFLGNPMMHVRQLVAKAYAALTPFNCITSEMKEIGRNTLSLYDVNTSHGYLLIHSYLREKLIDDAYAVRSAEMPKDNSAFDLSNNLGVYKHIDFADKCHKIFKNIETISPCYMVRTLFLQQIEISEIRLRSRALFYSHLPVNEHIMSSQKIQPGFFQFVGYLARLYAIDTKCLIEKSLEPSFDQHYVDQILNSNYPEIPIEFLRGLSLWIPLLEFILKYLMSIQDKHHQLVLDEIVTFTLKTIKHASLKINEPPIDEARLDELKFDKRIDNKLEFDEITEEFNQIEMTATNNLILVKNSLTLAFSKCEKSINKVLSHVLDICMDEKESVRWRAVEYIEVVLHRFAQLNNRNKLTIMQCCLILLKDEIVEIRKVISMSLQKYTVSKDVLQPQHEEIVYQQLLSNILQLQFDIATADDNVDFVRYFTRAIEDGGSDATIENPFNHDDNIFYKEESKFLNLCFLYNSPSQDCCTRKDHFDVTHAIQTGHFRKLREEAGSSYDDLRTILYLKEKDYLTRKLDAVAQQ